MGKLFATALVALGMLTGHMATTAHAGDRGEWVDIGTATSAYGKRDKDYWTRVWYDKQVKRGRYVKRNGRYYKTNSRKAAYSSKKSQKAAVKRSVPAGRVLAKVDLSSQTMSVYKGGRRLHTWPVSTGRDGYRTPTGTWSVKRMHKEYYSKKYDNAPMPYAMFYNGGFAIHGTNSISRLGRTASHGCVRLHPANAATLFSMIKRSGGTVKVTQ